MATRRASASPGTACEGLAHLCAKPSTARGQPLAQSGHAVPGPNQSLGGKGRALLEMGPARLGRAVAVATCYIALQTE